MCLRESMGAQQQQEDVLLLLNCWLAGEGKSLWLGHTWLHLGGQQAVCISTVFYANFATPCDSLAGVSTAAAAVLFWLDFFSTLHTTMKTATKLCICRLIKFKAVAIIIIILLILIIISRRSRAAAEGIISPLVQVATEEDQRVVWWVSGLLYEVCYII